MCVRLRPGAREAVRPRCAQGVISRSPARPRSTHAHARPRRAVVAEGDVAAIMGAVLRQGRVGLKFKAASNAADEAFPTAIGVNLCPWRNSRVPGAPELAKFCVCAIKREPVNPDPSRACSQTASLACGGPLNRFQDARRAHMAKPRSIIDKVWDAHVVEAQTPERPAVLYIDLHLIH